MTHTFTGHIAGLGTTSGVRLVVGAWDESPYGAFTDVMVELADGHRVLVAPDRVVADFVASVYRFDEVRVEPVACLRGPEWRISSTSVEVAFRPGRRHPLDLPLHLVPPPLRDRRGWARLCNPPARRLVPGVATYGSAGGGAEEWYAARSVRRLASASASWEGADLGRLAPVSPPVRFGFASAPAAPCLTRLRSHVRLPGTR